MQRTTAVYEEAGIVARRGNAFTYGDSCDWRPKYSLWGQQDAETEIARESHRDSLHKKSKRQRKSAKHFMGHQEDLSSPSSSDEDSLVVHYVTNGRDPGVGAGKWLCQRVLIPRRTSKTKSQTKNVFFV
jgi:hypothetical protein